MAQRVISSKDTNQDADPVDLPAAVIEQATPSTSGENEKGNLNKIA